MDGNTYLKNSNTKPMCIWYPYSQAKDISPNRCSAPNCTELCYDTQGHSVPVSHEARSCDVCHNWYCGIHKRIDLVPRFKRSQVVYLCPSCQEATKGQEDIGLKSSFRTKINRLWFQAHPTTVGFQDATITMFAGP